jgi:hypothetical protein
MHKAKLKVPPATAAMLRPQTKVKQVVDQPNQPSLLRRITSCQEVSPLSLLERMGLPSHHTERLQSRNISTESLMIADVDERPKQKELGGSSTPWIDSQLYQCPLATRLSSPTYSSCTQLDETTKRPLLERLTDPVLPQLKRKLSETQVNQFPKKIRSGTTSSTSLPKGEQPRMTWMTTSPPIQSDNDTPKQTCLGMDCDLGENLSISSSAMHEPANSSSIMEKTYRGQSSLSERLKTLQKGSSRPSGSVSSKASPLTSTISSLQSAALRSMKIGRRALERHTSLSARARQRGKSGLTEIGSQHGKRPLEPLPLPSHTVLTSSTTISSTSSPNLIRSKSEPTNGSSCTTSQSETTSGVGSQYSSSSVNGSPTSTRLSSSLTGSNSPPTWAEKELQPRQQTGDPKYATSSIHHPDAHTTPANTVTPAKDAAKKGTAVQTAQARESSEQGLQPKYLRYNLWGADQSSPQTIAEWSETAKPLPRPPQAELEDPLINATLASFPHLFAVNTPLDIDRFDELLAEHPNRPFVNSVIAGLREGFWPWADTHLPGYPSEHVQPPSGKYTDEHLTFFRKQLKHEQAKGRYSSSAGRRLLPGMYCMPIYAVPKPGSSDLRLVNDYSAGVYSLNSMVDHTQVTGYPLDNLHQLAQMLLILHALVSALLVLWKSDIAEAYRLCPLHPVWQLKQAVCIDGEFYIDRACCFGSSASFAIFAALNSLIAWIAKNRRGINPLITYVDDSSGAAPATETTFYEPYGTDIPTPQASLLALWDELRVPHKPSKQVHGETLTVIGILVDPNNLTFSLPDIARQRLTLELEKWSSPRTIRFPLRRWQKLCGWINWILNVYPLLRPCLNNVYPKLAGKSRRNQHITLNNSVRSDFRWALDTLNSLPPIRILDSIIWDADDAGVTVLCDACPDGLGFWVPATSRGFYAPSPFASPPFIFYLEALCTLNALLFVSDTACPATRVLIYTDNQNTVDIFSSLRCLPAYNGIVKASVDFRLRAGLDLRVLHIPGAENGVADALSRNDFNRALELCPSLSIDTFNPFCPDVPSESLEPPHFQLGGGEK